jgi:tetratricopeptide (TPR) repeat protein
MPKRSTIGVLRSTPYDVTRSDRVLRQAVSVEPGYVEALNNRGSLQALRRHSEAIESYDRALSLEPDCVQALFDRGVALQAP